MVFLIGFRFMRSKLSDFASRKIHLADVLQVGKGKLIDHKQLSLLNEWRVWPKPLRRWSSDIPTLTTRKVWLTELPLNT